MWLFLLVNRIIVYLQSSPCSVRIKRKAPNNLRKAKCQTLRERKGQEPLQQLTDVAALAVLAAVADIGGPVIVGRVHIGLRHDVGTLSKSKRRRERCESVMLQTPLTLSTFPSTAFRPII